jgi:hypothetical protein
MKNFKREKDHSRAGRKTRKRKLQDTIRDLPEENACEVPPGTSLHCISEHSVVRNKIYTITEKTLDVTKDIREAKKLKKASGDGDLSKLRVIEPAESDQSSSSKVSSAMFKTNDGEATLDGILLDNTGIADGSNVPSEESRVAKLEKENKTMKTILKDVNSNSMPFNEKECTGGIESKPARFIVFIGMLSSIISPPLS